MSGPRKLAGRSGRLALNLPEASQQCSGKVVLSYGPTSFFSGKNKKENMAMKTVPELKTGSINTLKCPGQKPLVWGGQGSPGKQNQEEVHEHTEIHHEGAAPASVETEKPRDLQAGGRGKAPAPSGPCPQPRGPGAPAPEDRRWASRLQQRADRPALRLSPGSGRWQTARCSPTPASAVFRTPLADSKVRLFQKHPHGHTQTCCSTSFLGAPWRSRVGTQS